MKKNFLIPVALLLQTALFAASAPDFTVTTSNGQLRKLYQDYVNQHKLMVLEIFFTTCPPCATHVPYLQALYQNMKTTYPSQVEFMLLSDKSADTDPVVNAYLTVKGLTMPAAGSSGGSLAAVQPYKNGEFGLFVGTPTFIIIAPGSGEVFFDIRGNTPQETMSLINQKINELLQCTITTPSGAPLDSVNLHFSHEDQTADLLALDGRYRVPNDQFLSGSFDIAVFKNDKPLNGVSTFDLLLISKHILNLDTFDSPYQKLAADVNLSGTITSFDIVQIRKLILGIFDKLPGVGSKWGFYPPGASATAMQCVDFVGYKYGDVNFSASAGFQEDRAGDRDRAYLYCDNRRLERGRSYRILVYTRNDLRISGLQLAFGTAPSRLHIRSIESPVLQGFSEENYNLELQRAEGYVPLSWTSTGRPAEVVAGEPLLILGVEALQDGLLCDMLGLRQQLRAEAYGESGELQPLELEWREPERGENDALQLAPNPARETVFATFYAEQGGDVLFQIIDMQGKTVFEKSVATIQGTNRAELRPGTSLSGLHFVKMSGVAAGKVFFEK